MTTTLRLIFFASLLGLSSCLKAPNLDPDFGPEVTPAEYQKVVGQLEFPDPLTIKKGEFAYMTNETYVEGRSFALNSRWAYTITDRMDDSTGFNINYVKELHEYTGTQEKVSTTSASARINKALAIGSLANFDKVGIEFIGKTETTSNVPKAYALKLESQAAKERKVTFHNLKIEKGFFPVPQFVSLRANCGGRKPEDCQKPLKAFFVSFDQVVRGDGDGQKLHVDYVVSPDAPYFANALLEDNFWPGVLRSCISTNMPIQGQRIRIAYCDEVRDYTSGE